MNLLDSDIKTVKGVGDSKAKLLNKLNVKTIWDMLNLFPRKIEDRREVKKIADLHDGETVCINATVFSQMQEKRIRKGFSVYSMIVKDDSASIICTFYNNKYVMNTFKVGQTYTFYGKINIKYGKREIVTPIFESVSSSVNTKCLVPVYPLSAGLTQNFIYKTMLECIKYIDGNIYDCIPAYIKKEYGLCDISFAMRNIHFPKDTESFDIAKKRLVFEELFIMQIGLYNIKGLRETAVGTVFKDTDFTPYVNSLPFTLTNAQNRVLNEIASDLSKNIAMNRLIQGDVGSGKTAIAAAALYLSAKNGYQGALMAPTEILATQHYASLSPAFNKLGFNVDLLTGSMGAKAKKEVLQRLQSGETDIVIGTHALIEDKVVFKNLSLIITDEQHRFGVRQREAFFAKGDSPHLLVMTATPIPRTLAIVMYGDLDISIIDELPPSRKTVDTFVVDENMRQRIYAFVRKNVNAGHQCYIVCPAVEDSETLDLKAVTSFAKNLDEVIFPDINVSFIHGKMKAKEKDEIMQKFLDNEVKILVSTTVIEVGVNVPNATLMVVENAERFGLSQLHQLRGRVGRGSDKSYCILFCDSASDNSASRMDIMAKTNDGFLIAEKDLEIRGPGEFFGTRQHGLPEFKIASLFTDMNILMDTRKATNDIIKNDPLFEKEEHALLKRRIDNFFNKSDKILV